MSALPHLRCRPSTTGNRISSLDRKHIILACVFVIFLSGRACVAPRTFVCSVLVVSFMPLCVRCSYLGKVGLSPLQDTYAGGSPGPSRLPGPCAGQAFHPFCIELSLPSRPAVSLGSAGSGESSAGSGSAGVSSDSRPFREGGPPPYGALSGPSRRPFSDQGPPRPLSGRAGSHSRCVCPRASAWTRPQRRRSVARLTVLRPWGLSRGLLG